MTSSTNYIYVNIQKGKHSLVRCLVNIVKM